jgi:hypothetical protein
VPAFEFRRTHDGLAYRYELLDDGRWKRSDLDLWCEKRPDGWRVVDPTGAVRGWPLDGEGDGSSPPPGRWHSEKGRKRYIYELVYL